MDKLAQKNRSKVIDVLTERLTFERAGVKLYDAILARLTAEGGPDLDDMQEALKQHRDQEKEHEEWLEEQIAALGGDAHGQTEMSRLTETESQGIEKVILGQDAPLANQFHALLAAELVDNAGWDLLVELADEAGDKAAKKEFKRRLHEEEEHLVFVRRAALRFARRIVLGEQVSMPSSP
jgi:bacterioferritin (cytochrome b1)